MGYMGFGMRKEVYKRKPKKSFERIKKFQKPVSNTDNPPEYNVSKEYQSFRFKSLRDRRWFKLTLRVLGLLVIFYIVLVSVIIPYQFERGKEKFETHGISTFFVDNHFDYLLDFVSERSDKILMVEKQWFYSRVGIWIKSSDYEEGGFYGSRIVDHNASDKVLIQNGVLSVSTETENKVFVSDWSIYLTVNNIDQLEESVIAYLGTTKSELDPILRSVFDNDLELKNSDKGTELSFDNYYGNYSIHFQLELDTGFVVLKQIKADTYLTKRTYSY